MTNVVTNAGKKEIGAWSPTHLQRSQFLTQGVPVVLDAEPYNLRPTFFCPVVKVCVTVL